MADSPMLRHRDRLAAILIAEGKLSFKEIAEKCDMSESRLRILRNSPLFQELVSEVGGRIMDAGVKRVVDDLMDDAPANLQFIKRVRDGGLDDLDSDKVNVRLRASDMLWSRQVPKVDDTGAGDNAKIVMTTGMFQQMMSAMAAAGIPVPIDVTPIKHPITAEDALARAVAAELIDPDEVEN